VGSASQGSADPGVRKVPLVGGQYFAVVDAADFEAVSKWRWHARKKSTRLSIYAIRYFSENNRTRSEYMHQLILKAQPGFSIDHISRDGLDNRRSNLRLATVTQNNANVGKLRKTTTSRFKGVSKERGARLFRAQINVNGRKTFIGRFAKDEDAAWAYDREARRVFGPFAFCNFPPPPTIYRAPQFAATP
jgi:hypothetical protein